jgi:hypothetical protein
LFARYAAELTQHTAVDHRSITMYPIPPEHTEDGHSVGWNDELSELDKDFVGRLSRPDAGLRPRLPVL